MVELLDQAPSDVPAVAGAALFAAERRLKELEHDPSLEYCYWLLVRIAAASREPEFRRAMERLGIAIPDNSTALGFISAVSDRVRAEAHEYTESGPFTEIASLALRRSLSESVGLHGRSLFRSSIEDVQDAFARYSTPARFAPVASTFFANMLGRTLRFYIDRALSLNVGGDHGLADVGDSEQFTMALDTYARESTRIMEPFAADWYSKHRWESGSAISREEAAGFVKVALRKLRRELIVSHQ